MLSKFRTGLNMIWQREVIFYEQRAKCPTTLLHLIEITRTERELNNEEARHAYPE